MPNYSVNKPINEDFSGGIDVIIDLAMEKQASDIHIGGDEKVAVRVFREVEFLEDLGKISAAQAEKMILDLIAKEELMQKLFTERELDFPYLHAGEITFRCNAFYKNGNLSISMRRVSEKIPTLEEIAAPAELRNLIQEKKQGLVLICGPAGHGKTTTMFSLLNEINQTRSGHIITIEDPVEYKLESAKCVVSQRQVATDTHSFQNSLRAAMRQDPDVVVIGEIRDQETMETVLKLCASGHLVFSTIHSANALQTFHRILRMFPVAYHESILHQLADSLLAVVNQRLTPKTGGGCAAVFELMLANFAIRNAIRTNNMTQLENTIETSSRSGMTTFTRSAEKLAAQGIVNQFSL